MQLPPKANQYKTISNAAKCVTTKAKTDQYKINAKVIVYASDKYKAGKHKMVFTAPTTCQRESINAYEIIE